jgi:hypothetical protein
MPTMVAALVTHIKPMSGTVPPLADFGPSLNKSDSSLRIHSMLLAGGYSRSLQEKQRIQLVQLRIKSLFRPLDIG